MQRVRALIDCGATSIFMALRLRKQLGLADKPAYVTTLGLNGHVMAHASESRKTMFTVQYMEQLSPVQESEVLIVPMRAYDLVLGLPWFQSRNPDVDWQSGRLFALRTPRGIRSGGSGPGRPSRMPRESTRIYGLEGGVFRRSLRHPRYSNTWSNCL
jgi:hypothetical protein